MNFFICRYPNLDVHHYKPVQIRSYFDTDDPKNLDKIIEIAEQKSQRYGELYRSDIQRPFSMKTTFCNIKHLDLFILQPAFLSMAVCKYITAR